jgi:hypothetical protein
VASVLIVGLLSTFVIVSPGVVANKNCEIFPKGQVWQKSRVQAVRCYEKKASQIGAKQMFINIHIDL